MKADAQPSAEKEALEWATGYFRERCDRLHPSWRRRALESDAACIVALYDNIPKWTMRSLTGFAKGLAREDRQAGDLVREAVTRLAERGVPLRPSLRDFMRTKRRPGPDTRPRYFDHQVCDAIRHIVSTWKIYATHNLTREQASAASIVRDALERGAGIRVSDAKIQGIWFAENRALKKASRSRPLRQSVRKK